SCRLSNPVSSPNAGRGRCDRLPVRGNLLGSRVDAADTSPYNPRRIEMRTGDILVLVSDGLTEGHRGGDPFGYRFTQTIEEHAGQNTMAIGEAILGEWRSHPRREDLADDVTVVVARMSVGG